VAIKLYYGGFGDYRVFAVAENEQEAIDVIGKKINAPFLPVTVEEISEVDGYSVCVGVESAKNSVETPAEAEKTAESAEPTEEAAQRHCKKCDFTCETQGELLKHYRECHPKEG
jgi:ribosomal protein S4